MVWRCRQPCELHCADIDAVSRVNCPVVDINAVSRLNCSVADIDAVSRVNCPVADIDAVSRVNCPVADIDASRTRICMSFMYKQCFSLHCAVSLHSLCTVHLRCVFIFQFTCAVSLFFTIKDIYAFSKCRFLNSLFQM